MHHSSCLYALAAETHAVSTAVATETSASKTESSSDAEIPNIRDMLRRQYQHDKQSSEKIMAFNAPCNGTMRNTKRANSKPSYPKLLVFTT
mmetsp:Transcript_6912/g.10320  ORF Transcript_6912/g.10320 Transcript_6912/m.10320 type:complete len:91 (-) Transcript_6912:948-1220(-)